MPAKNGKGVIWDASTKAQASSPIQVVRLTAICFKQSICLIHCFYLVLLLQCYFLRHPVKVDYAGLEEDMRALGHDCTAKAITHQFSHMRNNSKSAAPSTNKDAGSDDNTPAPNDSPAKPKAGTKAKSTIAAANGKKPRGKVENGNATTNGNKRKRGGKNAAAAVEEEDEAMTGNGAKDEEGHEDKKVKVEDAADSSEGGEGEI
ncbi:MAG: hypothetical protein Q9222_002230 [Ikaeria aurantiellina]